MIIGPSPLRGLAETLVWHVRTEVVLDATHAPGGQLVLWQVEADAAQLENGGLGFWSL